MLAPWALEEMRTADFGDTRLDERVSKLLSDFGQRPTASIPAACGGHAETAAAYRFFDNDKVTFETVLQPHYAQTRQRIAAQPVALLVQDTTEIDVTRPDMEVKGTGPLSTPGRRGVFLHPLEAFAEDGTPLGTVSALAWARADEPDVTSATKRKRRKAAPIEEKESHRWIEGLRQARAVAEAVPETTCICVADSEADIYEIFAEPRGGAAGRPVELLIRGCQDRVVASPDDSSELTRLRTAMAAAPVLFSQEISVRRRTSKIACEDRARRKSRGDRKAIVSVRAASMTLCPPNRRGRRLPPVKVNVVWVHEENPPEGEEPIDWLLITTLPIGDTEAVQKVITFYTRRWMIELFFRTLKSGCRVEERRFEHIDRLLPCLALYMIVAWRTLLVCRMGRSCPDISCETIFEPEEWKSVYVAVRQQPPPSQPPRLEEMVRLVAQLGGYVNRPGRKDPPGVQTVWIGLQRMYDLAWAWTAFGPEARPKLV